MWPKVITMTKRDEVSPCITVQVCQRQSVALRVFSLDSNKAVYPEMFNKTHKLLSMQKLENQTYDSKTKKTLLLPSNHH